MASFKIINLGCKANQYDGGRLGGLLKSAGFVLADKNADAVIINTCAVTKAAVAKSRQAISRSRRENPRAKIIIAGCCPRVYKDDFRKSVKADLVWDKNDQLGLVKKIKKLCPDANCQLPTANCESFGSPENKQDRSRYFLKVQDGCEQFCSYCVIPYARGRLKSRLIAEILNEAEAAVQKGYREIVLTGIHLGLFGVNNEDKKAEEKGADLLRLLRRLVKIKNLERVRLSSIEITEVKDGLIDFMAAERKMCRHLHIPLQSGCDRILKLMKRPCDTGFFSAKIKKIRRAMPDIAISTDIIVGFPGETEKDFTETCRFAEKTAFSFLHVFSFSAHERTEAFSLPDRVDSKEIAGRSERLRELGRKLEAAYRRKFVGRNLKVVMEKSRDRFLRGRSEYYFEVKFLSKDILNRPKGSLVGRTVELKLKK